jgi:hypothetical protein
VSVWQQIRRRDRDIHPLAVDDRTLELVVVADLVHRAGLAVQRRRRAVLRLKRGRERAVRVRRGRAGRNARAREPGVRRQLLEQRDDRLEERDGVGTLRRARWEALGLQRREAGAVLMWAAPVNGLVRWRYAKHTLAHSCSHSSCNLCVSMLSEPVARIEYLITGVVVLPVSVHECQHVTSALRSEQLRYQSVRYVLHSVSMRTNAVDARICARRVAALGVARRAVVRPQAVDRPAVRRARHRVCAGAQLSARIPCRSS